MQPMNAIAILCMPLLLPKRLLYSLDTAHCRRLPRRPPDLHNQESHKVLPGPIATVRTQHVQVLEFQCPAFLLHSIIDLPVVVEQVHPLLRNLFLREIVRLHFHCRRQPPNGRTPGKFIESRHGLSRRNGFASEVGAKILAPREGSAGDECLL